MATVVRCAVMTCAVALAATTCAADWSQWRGPERNGLVPDSPALIDAIPADGLKPVWTSEKVPGGGSGGYGSVVVADGRAFVYSNTRYAVPIATRSLTKQGLARIGWSVGMPDELLARVEEARTSAERKNLDRRAVRDWVNKWVGANLTREQGAFRSGCSRRLTLGVAALPADMCRKLETVVDKEFPTVDALDRWLTENAFEGDARRSVLRAIPTTRNAAHDHVFCLDAATGRTLWRKELPGTYTGYLSSSTPCIADGRCYVMGSGGNIYCLNVADGEVIWQAKGKTRPNETHASSIVVLDGLAVLLAGQLTALDAATGDIAWTQPEVVLRESYSSAAYWRHEGATYLVVNGSRDACCVAPKTGEVLWKVPGGGWSTPAIVGDDMVIYSARSRPGLVAYRLAMPAPRQAWSLPYRDRGASPVIRGGYVYALGGGNDAHAVCVELESGKLAWDEKLRGAAEIASPVEADGKLLGVVGSTLQIMATSPEGYRLLGEIDAKVTACTSPAFVDGRVFLRLGDAVACYDLRKDPN